MNPDDSLVPQQVYPHAADCAHGVEQRPHVLHIAQLAPGGSIGVPVREAVSSVYNEPCIQDPNRRGWLQLAHGREKRISREGARQAQTGVIEGRTDR